MNANTQVGLCKAYLYSATPETSRLQKNGRIAGPIVTISREAGARGNSIARALAPALEASAIIPHFRPWTVFNQDLLDHVIREHHLPRQTAAYFPEDKPDQIRGLVGELLGLHAGIYTSVRKCAETIRRLAVSGNAIVVGRGANLVTANVRHALHVRLVGDLDDRIHHFARVHGMTLKDAAAEVGKRDRARKRYVMRTFERDITDAHQYDLVINTSRFTDEAIVRMIRKAIEEKIGGPPRG
jgi:hypothetical protein